MVANRINLEIINRIPLEGADTQILCSGCAAACCREGVVMSLNAEEAQFLSEHGTTLEVYDASERSLGRRILERLIRKPSDNRQLMKLTSDCGNLETNSDTGRLDCSAYYDKRRPQICSNFKMGSYACGLLQLGRLRRD